MTPATVEARLCILFRILVVFRFGVCLGGGRHLPVHGAATPSSLPLMRARAPPYHASSGAHFNQDANHRTPASDAEGTRDGKGGGDDGKGGGDGGGEGGGENWRSGYSVQMAVIVFIGRAAEMAMGMKREAVGNRSVTGRSEMIVRVFRDGLSCRLTVLEMRK